MSNEVHTLVKRRIVGSPTMKSVLLYMADAASDDGSGIWVSKSNMALDLEFKSKRTVQTAIGEMVGMGLVQEVGHRKHFHGYTIEYQIDLNAIRALPETRPRNSGSKQTGAGNARVAQDVGGAGNAPVQEMHPTGAGNAPVQEMHPTGAGDAPHGVQEMHPNHPITIQEPCVSQDAPHTQDLDNHDLKKPRLKSGHGNATTASHAGETSDGRVSNSDTDFVFEDLFNQFVDVYPRIGNLLETEAALQLAIVDGADPTAILAGARAFAVEQKGNNKQYIAYSQNWVRDKRWTQHTPTTSATVDREKLLETHAKTIREGKAHLCSPISNETAWECVQAQLVTIQECRAVGKLL